MRNGGSNLFIDKSLFAKSAYAGMIVGVVTTLAASFTVARETARTPGQLEFESLDHVRVVKDGGGNQRYIEGAITIGDYIVLTKNEQLRRLQDSASAVPLQPIRLLSTGQIVLSEGRLIVEIEDLDTSDAIASDYGLELVSDLPALSRIVLQVPTVAVLERTKEALEQDYRVRSVELEFYSGGGVVQ